MTIPVLQNHLTRLLIFAFVLILACPAIAQERGLKSSLSKKRDPIEITSDRMRSEERGQKIIFSGNVLAVWGDLSIRSDVLEIYNHEDKNNNDPKATSIGGGQQLDEIIAIGNVDVRRGDRRAKGDRAVYLDKDQRIILKGSPKAIAWEGDNIIEGKEMIFFLESDRFQVNNRVRIKLFPGKSNSKKPRTRSRGKTAPKSRQP